MENLKKILIGARERVDPIILEVLGRGVEKKFQPLVWHQVGTGGKRLRPALAILSCQMLGGKLKDVLHPAAGLEILHNYTLIIDDMIDHSYFRRSQPTSWKKFGASIAECVSIYYSAAVFQAASPSPNPVLISEIFSQALKRIMDGEIWDVLMERAGRKDQSYVTKNRPQKVSLNNYLSMVSKKTASLLEASCWVGGVCARANPLQIKLLREFGFNLGVAFQIQDDILDIFADQKELGKKIGGDIMERKASNILILLTQGPPLMAILQKPKIIQTDVNKAINLIGQTDSRERAEKLAQKYIAKAQNALTQLPQNKHNQTLASLADFVINRSN